MKARVVVHPFLAIGEICAAWFEMPDYTAPNPPRPAEPGNEPREPEPEPRQPFWTYFVENPRPKNSQS